MQHNYSYQSVLAASEQIGWKVDDIIGGEKRLDFSKPFMPESPGQVQSLSFVASELSCHNRADLAPGEKANGGDGTNVLLNENAK